MNRTCLAQNEGLLSIKQLLYVLRYNKLVSEVFYGNINLFYFYKIKVIQSGPERITSF